MGFWRSYKKSKLIRFLFASNLGANVTQQSGVSLDVGDLKGNSSSTSIESKVESIYVGTMHNNHITINQHLRPGDEKDQKKTLIDTGQKRLGTRAMSLTISDTMDC